MSSKSLPAVAILGASGLIGEVIARHLAQDGYPVVPISRRFTAAQKAAFGESAVECPIASLDEAALSQRFVGNKIDIVVNCIGILQDGPRGGTAAVHVAFVERLVKVLRSGQSTSLLVHISIPGNSKDDRTPFSRTKREAERAIAAGSIPHIILRPGFVVAPAAYGGSALMRALAVLPFDLSKCEADQPFATTDVLDIARTIAVVAQRWQTGERTWNAVWEIMARQSTSVSDVLDAFRRHLGGPPRRWPLPSWLMEMGAKAGDVVAFFGWEPPVRSTALQEIRRGVAGDPEPWSAATGIEPASLESTLQRLPATVQEKWFARLYFAKAMILTSLVVFWIFSGLVALTVAFGAATSILTAHGLPPMFANAATVATSLTDIAVGTMIAFNRTCRAGLLLGIGTALLYVAGASALAPELWIDPLGPLLKIVPAIALMFVALAMLESR